MTFEEFQATGRNSLNLGYVEPELLNRPGRIYVEFFWIERCGPWWYVIVGNEECISSDLTECEQFLYEASDACEIGGPADA